MYNEGLKESLEVERVIGKIEGEKPGPTMVFVGGIHGNESSGVFALHRVLKKIKDEKISIKGTFIALAGNLWALEHGERFHTSDLNRLWKTEQIEALENQTFQPQNEDEQQQLELYQSLQNILEQESKPFYFIDLHTTSAPTIPFITVNDSLLNRLFTQQYPVPKILGIEEHLDGPLLSYINDMGYISFGFESGEHTDVQSVYGHEAFVYLSMVIAGMIHTNQIDFTQYYNILHQKKHGYYEIIYRHAIQEKDDFTMMPGFQNFQTLSKGTPLATHNGETILAEKNIQIFMPLYQKKGEDGYFIIQKINTLFLKLSQWIRLRKWDRLILLLPGIEPYQNNKHIFQVHLQTARFLTKPLLHLLGFRIYRQSKNTLLIKSREIYSKTKDYQIKDWRF